MKVTDLLILAVAGFLFYTGYNSNVVPGPVDGDVEITVEYEEEVFPSIPTDLTDLKILNKLDAIEMRDDDALILARAFAQAGSYILNDKSVLDLGQLALLNNSVVNNVMAYHGRGGYGGKINEVMKELYNHKLAFLKDAEGQVTSTELGPPGSPVRLALKSWMDGLSWKMSEIFMFNLPEPEST